LNASSDNKMRTHDKIVRPQQKTQSGSAGFAGRQRGSLVIAKDGTAWRSPCAAIRRDFTVVIACLRRRLRRH